MKGMYYQFEFYFDLTWWWVLLSIILHTNSLLFQMKYHVGPSKFQLPLSCPLTAALGPGLPATLSPNSSAMLPPGYLLPAGSYGGMASGPLYSQQWPGMRSPVGSMVPVGLLGAARMMPYGTMTNPGIQAYPLVMHSPENGPSPKTTRTTWSTLCMYVQDSPLYSVHQSHTCT